jgi:hypothetical protein
MRSFAMRRCAARACLLVDDLYRRSDPMFRGLAAFPNVECGFQPLLRAPEHCQPYAGS